MSEQQPSETVVPSTRVEASRPAPEPSVGRAFARVPELDGVRGIAILLVMVYHMTIMTSPTAVDRAARAVTGMMWSGVDLFFVLSGFLITSILLETRGRQGYFRSFYARRVLRIFPLYYAVLFLALVILPHIPHPKAQNFGRIAGDEWWYWTYLSNIVIGLRQAWRHGIVDVSWSLAIEEQFYALWPLVVFLCSPRTLKRVCVALVIAALASRTALTLDGGNWLSIYVWTPCRLDGLAVGAFVAIWAREHGIASLRPAAKLILPVALGAVLLLRATGDHQIEEGPIGMTVGYSLIAFAMGSALVLSLTSRQGGRLSATLRTPFLQTLGKYSYALYLFHLPLRALIRDTVYGPTRFWTIAGSQLPGQLLFYAAGIALTLAAARLSWVVLEQPMLRLKRYFPEPSAGARGAAAVAPVTTPAPESAAS